MQFILPTARPRSIQLLTSLKEGVAPGDWLTVGSGGMNKVADPTMVQQGAETLAKEFPGNPVYAFTSGFSNVELLAHALKPPVVGIFYDYEPNYPNEPEFSFDPQVTAQNLAKATATAHAHQLRLIAYLTGQAILRPAHAWNYAEFRSSCDGIVVQTQAALKNGRWTDALDRLGQQFGTSLPPVQITVRPGLPNTVDLPTATGAYDEAVRRGFPAVTVFWTPNAALELRTMLEHRLGRPLAAPPTPPTPPPESGD
jgi:hypothetical protein